METCQKCRDNVDELIFGFCMECLEENLDEKLNQEISEYTRERREKE